MSLQLPDDLFQTRLSPTDSSTAVRFQVTLERAAHADGLHVESLRRAGARRVQRAEDADEDHRGSATTIV